MIIAVAGPYSAPDAATREKNLLAMNTAAAEIYRKGHIPVIGVNAALAVAEASGLEGEKRYRLIMDISLAVVGACDALLLLASSPGADKERDLIEAKGGTIYFHTSEIPDLAC